MGHSGVERDDTAGVVDGAMKNFWQTLKRPFLALAPMAGVTDLAFRTMCKRFGADVIYTEFASANALVHGNEATRRMIAFAETERPVVCQIFSNDPHMSARAARILEDMGFDGIDINFGCPAYKVVTHGGGVAMMRDLDLCHALVSAVLLATKLPVSIKIRSRIGGERQKGVEARKQSVTALDLVKRLSDLPVAAIMIHGRSYEKPFDGAPDVDMIRQVKEIAGCPVVANGGAYSPEEAKVLWEATAADGIGVGRGSHGRPWIFTQIKEYLSTGAYHELSWQEKKEAILTHARLAFSLAGARGLIEMRKHLAWYVKGIYNASEIRNLLVQTETLSDIELVLTQISELET